MFGESEDGGPGCPRAGDGLRRKRGKCRLSMSSRAALLCSVREPHQMAPSRPQPPTPSPQPSSPPIPHLSPLPHPCAARAGSLLLQPPLGCFPGGGRQRFPRPMAQGGHRGPALFRAPLLAHIQVSGQVSYLPGLGPSVRAGKPVTIPGGRARALLRKEAHGQELEPGLLPGCRPPQAGQQGHCPPREGSALTRPLCHGDSASGQ